MRELQSRSDGIHAERAVRRFPVPRCTAAIVSVVTREWGHVRGGEELDENPVGVAYRRGDGAGRERASAYVGRAELDEGRQHALEVDAEGNHDGSGGRRGRGQTVW